MKLFPKLALAVSLLLVSTTLTLSLFFYWAERGSIRTQADEERHAILQNLALITQESLLTDDDLLLVKYTRWLQKGNPSLLSASVVNPEGEVLAHSEPQQIGTSIKQADAPHNPDMLVLTQSVHLGTRWVATTSVGFSERRFEETVQARLSGLKRRLGLIAIAAIIAGLAISFLLALSWTRPIDALVQASRSVGQGRYTLDLTATSVRRDEIGTLSRAFQSMAKDLAKLDQMKEDFVSAVTHELRSPLGAIESYLNLIQVESRDGFSPSLWQNYMERLRVNTQRLTRFVNDLLDVAALERGKVNLEWERVSLPALIQDIATFFAAKLGERRLICTTNIPDTRLPSAWADANKVRQVLVNLLSNAIKFTPDGGSIEIGVKDRPQEKVLEVYVKDSGLGISPEDQAKIFNMFEQVHSARRKVNGPKGTGLGLSISRALIELHNGQLKVQSKPGEGSTFSFTLPAVAEAIV